jgi:hypothetical protein
VGEDSCDSLGVGKSIRLSVLNLLPIRCGTGAAGAGKAEGLRRWGRWWSALGDGRAEGVGQWGRVGRWVVGWWGWDWGSSRFAVVDPIVVGVIGWVGQGFGWRGAVYLGVRWVRTFRG